MYATTVNHMKRKNCYSLSPQIDSSSHILLPFINFVTPALLLDQAAVPFQALRKIRLLSESPLLMSYLDAQDFLPNLCIRRQYQVQMLLIKVITTKIFVSM